MTRPSRTRRILKWTGVGLSFAVIAAWVINSCYRFCVTLYLGAFAYSVTFSNGIVLIDRLPNVFGANAGLQFEAAATSSRKLIPSSMEVWDNPPGDGPLWFSTGYLLLAFAIPTAWLWHRDRRLFSCSPDHLLCSRCGYDLTGNTSGVCSECGLRASVRSYR